MTEQNHFEETKAVIKKINLFKTQTKIHSPQINEQDLKLVVWGHGRVQEQQGPVCSLWIMCFHLAIRQGASTPDF